MVIDQHQNGEFGSTDLPFGFLKEWLPREIVGLSPSFPSWDHHDHPKKSVVILLFIPPKDPTSNSTARILLTRRTTKVGSHKGQIGFPGGRVDPGEERDPRITGCRELEEEIGILPRSLMFLGSLPLTTAIDGSPVLPLLALSSIAEEELQKNPEEVAEVLLPPWTSLGKDRNRPFHFSIFGIWRKSDLFSLPANPVWGLTARILADAALG